MHILYVYLLLLKDNKLNTVHAHLYLNIIMLINVFYSKSIEIVLFINSVVNAL